MASFEDIEHLLRRTGFGGTRAEITALMPLSWADAVDVVLDVSNAPDPAAGPPLPDPTQDLVGDQWGETYRAMCSWWMERARTTETPIVEKLVLFWSGVLTSSLDTARHGLMWDQNRLFRTHGLGRWDDLLQAAAVQPAMLIYLDNRANVKGHPNENFARELMELFTLGVGHYTESDVRESARAWTGHTVDRATLRYEFRPRLHDAGTKTFMGTTRNWDGPMIIDHILRGPTETDAARFLARRLWTFLAGSPVGDDVIDALATTFVRHDLEILELVRAILLRPEFRSVATKQGLVREPFDFVVSALRAAGFSAYEVAPVWLLRSMGQELFRPPNVDGWGSNEYWISTAMAWARSTFADQMAWQASNEKRLWADSRTLPVDVAVERVLDQMGVFSPSTATRNALRTAVVEHRSGSARWAEVWTLMNLVLLTPEFQLA